MIPIKKIARPKRTPMMKRFGEELYKTPEYMKVNNFIQIVVVKILQKLKMKLVKLPILYNLIDNKTQFGTLWLDTELYFIHTKLGVELFDPVPFYQPIMHISNQVWEKFHNN